MKILIVSEFFPAGKDLRFSGGVEARNLFHVKYLAKKHKVIILTSNQGKEKRIFKKGNLVIYRVGPKKEYQAKRTFLGSLSNLKFIFDAIKLGMSLDFDVVEGTNFVTHTIALQVGKRTKKPVVFWYPDVYLDSWIKNYGLLQGLFGYVLEKLNLRSKPNHYVAISNSTKQKLVKIGINPSQISVIPCGVDGKEFKKSEEKYQRKTIISISRLVEYKNLQNLIRAFKIVKNRIGDANLIIVGEGPQEDKLTSQAKKLKILDSIKFYKNLKRSQLISLLKRSHIFCLPSFVEGFSIVTIEAAAAGLPYIVSNIPVMKEVTKSGQGGELVNPKNYQQIASSMIKLLGNHNHYKNKSIQAKKLAQIYDWSLSAKETLKTYKNAINEHKK